MAKLTRRACLGLPMLALAGAVPLGDGAHAARPVRIARTASGIEFWLVEEPSIPLVAMRFAFAGGALHDLTGRAGLASLLAAVVGEGGGDLDAQAFARQMADLGAQMAVTGRRDRISGGLDALSARIESAVALLAGALAVPHLDMETVERARAQRLTDLEAGGSEPRRVAFERWWAETFADARGSPVDGTPASVAAITRSDLARQHRLLLTRDALRVVVVGDVTQVRAEALVERAFAGLPATAPGRLAGPFAEPKRASEPAMHRMPAAVATVAFGGPAPALQHPDHVALRILAQVIGSGDFDSTLMEEIRVKRGLAYAVSTSLIADSSVAVVLGGMATEPGRREEAFTVLREVLARVARDGPTEEQVAAAKSHLNGSAALDVDSNAKLASQLLDAWMQGLGPDAAAVRQAAIERASIDDVRRAGRAWLDPERLNYAVVVPPG